MKKTNVVVFSVYLFLSPSCCSDKTVVMTGQTSEGLTTSTVTFYSDQTYSIEDKTFLTTHKVKGKYVIKDSSITLTVLKDNHLLKSSQLLLRKGSFSNIILSQLNNENKIDTLLPVFYMNME